MEIPFNREDQLYHKLSIKNDRLSIELQDQVAEPPGSASSAQRPGPVQAPEPEFLPGDPRIELIDADIGAYLQEEFVTKDLDKLAPHLWLMTTQNSGNISSLTEQLARGRKVVVSHNPGLHLVWVKNRVFLKPLPEYLLSHAFWEYYLLKDRENIDETQRLEVIKAARGFLRSYTYLIQRKSDFVLATQEKTRLIPENIKFEDFIRFIRKCKTNVKDDSVSPRYQFGELRLTRLNFWTRIFLRKTTYTKVEWEYGAYFAQFYAPMLFIFAVISLLLSSVQVVLGVRAVLTPDDDAWLKFAKVARGCALSAIFFIACAITVLLLMLAASWMRELIFALKHLKRGNVNDNQVNKNPVNKNPVNNVTVNNDDPAPVVVVVEQ